MATATERNTTRSRNKTSTRKSTTKSSMKKGRKKVPQREHVDNAVKNEVILIGIFATAIFLFLCNINVIRGDVGSFVKSVMFGIFGILAYVIPIICFVAFAFGISNKGNTIAILKLVAGVVFLFLLGILATLITGQLDDVEQGHVISSLYKISNNGILSGGGVLFGGIAYFLKSHIGMGGTIFMEVVFGIICLVILTEKSFLNGLKRGSHRVYENASAGVARYREHLQEQYDDDLDEFEELLEDDANDAIEDKTQKEIQKKKLRMEKRARGVMPSAAIMKEEKIAKMSPKDDVHEIVWKEEPKNKEDKKETGLTDKIVKSDLEQLERINIRSVQMDPISDFVQEESKAEDIPYEALSFARRDLERPSYVVKEEFAENNVEEEILLDNPTQKNEISQAEVDEAIPDDVFTNKRFTESVDQTLPQIQKVEAKQEDHIDIYRMPEPVTEQVHKHKTETAAEKQEIMQESQKISEDIQQTQEQIKKKYQIPPYQLLKRGDKNNTGDSTQELKKTAYHLQQTLKTFGVNVTVTDISQGPSVTRFELQPEQGVKVSKIVGLADDIKLNLAATDIRIEAPIPGKAAVGIEVPNKENTPVALRDLLESKEFKQFPSNIAFAVGKDIGGQTVVTDIAKMPHLLIAGATGSGKSVCINTIIMGILYKADPEDVKLIMIDPKVVELSVYNGIPHLMIPVVTDPKKAAAALQWGVSEMTDRYKKFADMNVRDLKGYNKAVENGKLDENGQPLHKMPQLVIIVDELADLMMVASGDVEEAICRLAQLARAAGIHLIIATQRPSVDVITGLIKANMPSRIAFSVSSGVDSRTILDMNGAEKLLGRGDMLFYPQGYAKPARVQGAFVSDSEVSDVVDYIKNQALGNTYMEGIEEKISSLHATGNGGSQGGSELDTYFADAGKFVIEKDKASIGMLQRVFKIGFNRAARIVDQLEAAGVVGAEEGTKPRKILMTMSEFESYVEETL